jgi:hypothetical protein
VLDSVEVPFERGSIDTILDDGLLEFAFLSMERMHLMGQLEGNQQVIRVDEKDNQCENATGNPILQSFYILYFL